MKIESHKYYRHMVTGNVARGSVFTGLQVPPECLKEVIVTVAEEPEPEPETKTIREWLETLPDGHRERALEQCEELTGEGSAISLSDALVGFCKWSESREGHDFWSDVCKWASGFHLSLPPLPKEKKPEPRRGKPGEVWRLKHGPVCLLAERGSITLRSDYGGAFDGIGLGAHAFEEAVGHKRIAASLEEWARKEWGINENPEREEREAELKREIEEHKAHIANLMNREHRLRTEIAYYENAFAPRQSLTTARPHPAE